MIVDVTISRRSFVFGQSHVFGSVACVESTSLLLTPQPTRRNLLPLKFAQNHRHKNEKRPLSVDVRRSKTSYCLLIRDVLLRISKACVQMEEVMKLDLHVTGIATMIIIIIVTIIIRHFHISHNAPYLHKHCFQFLFGRL